MEQEKKKINLRIIIPVVVAIVVIAIVGVIISKSKKPEEEISKEEIKQLTYKEYSTLGLSFE